MSGLDSLAHDLRAAYFQTNAGTLKCYDAEAWNRVSRQARRLAGRDVMMRAVCSAPADDEQFDEVLKARHYNSHPSGVKCIDIVRHMTFAAGNAVKYVFRCWEKNGRQDLEKALYYLDDAARHADPVFLPSWRFKHQQLLDRVVAAEVDPNRASFFEFVKRARIIGARTTVRDMLDAA